MPKKKEKDNKEIVHKWYKLGIGGERYDKSLFKSWCDRSRRPYYFRQRIKDSGWMNLSGHIEVNSYLNLYKGR